MMDKVNKYTPEEIRAAIKKSAGDSLVYIGTDSSTGKKYTQFITVIIIHHGAKSGNGKGCEVFPYITSLPKYSRGRMKEKLMKEVQISMEHYYSIYYDESGELALPNDTVEIHIDINPDPKHKSSIAVKEAIGYVTGQGLIAKVKPHALAATGTSDWLGRRNAAVYLAS